MVYADTGSEEPATGVTYSSGNARAATVDDGSGLIRAIAPGIATITALHRGSGRSTTVQVQVDPPHTGNAHLTVGEGISTVYKPGKSLFLRAPFKLDVHQEWTGDRSIAAAALAAGVNVFSDGLYISPLSFGNPPDFASWKAKWDLWWADFASFISLNPSLHLFFTGDDIDRGIVGGANSGAAMQNSIAGPYSAQAIQYALSKAASSGRATAIDMIDEAPFSWCETPNPTDGRWGPNGACPHKPGIPDNAFAVLDGIIRNGRPAHPIPLSFPVSGPHLGPQSGNWMGPGSYADYASQYCGHLTEVYPAYPWAYSLKQDQQDFQYCLDNRLPYLDRTRPSIWLTEITGNGYTKKSNNANFTPGADQFGVPGPTAIRVAEQILYAVAQGMVGVRPYTYDGPSLVYARAHDPIGSGEETGSSPKGPGQDRWAAMSTAFNLIKNNEEDLLQGQMNAVDAGPDWTVGAREGGKSRVLVAINHAETLRSEKLELAPYIGGAKSIARYRVRGSVLRSDRVSPAPWITESLEAGECVVYIFVDSAREAPKPSRRR